MRITHVIPGLTHERGGTSTTLEALTRHQINAGHQVTVLTTDQGLRRGERPVALADGIRLEMTKVIGFDRIAYSPGFGRLVRRILPTTDVLHIHTVYTYPIHAALVEAERAQTPTIILPQGVLQKIRLRRGIIQKRIYLALDGHLLRRVCSAWHYTSSDESATSWPFENGPHFVLPLGIDPAEYAVDRAEARRRVQARWPQIADAPYVLYLSRLHPMKRPDFLIEAFLAGAPKHCKLVLAGPDECNQWSNWSARLLKHPSDASRVRWVGTILGKDKIDLLAGARAFALPSEHESFGVAPLEALATGTKILTSPFVDFAREAYAAGFAEIIELEKPKWIDTLASVLALSDEQESDGVVGAREWVQRLYSWESIAARLTEQYEKVLDGHSLAMANPM